jgi:succinyl-diaminopimelate desuccinylase
MLWLKAVTKGKQAHGSSPDSGANAFLAGSDLAVSLYRGLSEKFSAKDSLFSPDYSSFQPTKKEANVPNINTIPAEDVVYFDLRILPRYRNEEILAEVERVKAEIEDEYKVRIDASVVQESESKPTSAEAPLIVALGKAVKAVYGVETRPIGIGGGTVGAYLRNEGIDCAVWSRLDDEAHQPNEYAVISNILGDAKVMAELMTQ